MNVLQIINLAHTHIVLIIIIIIIIMNKNLSCSRRRITGELHNCIALISVNSNVACNGGRKRSQQRLTSIDWLVVGGDKMDPLIILVYCVMVL